MKKFLGVFIPLAFLFILFANPPSQNVSGNYLGRFALTKSIVDDFRLDITKYKSNLGYDQAIIKDKTYCAHDVGFSIFMIPSYVLVVKPISFVLSLSGKELDFNFQGYLSRIISIQLVSAVCFLYLILIFIKLKTAQVEWFAIIALYFSSLIPLYSCGVLSDTLSASLQFPVFYYILKNEKLTRLEIGLFIFFLTFLTLNKVVNLVIPAILCFTFLITKNRKFFLYALFSFIISIIIYLLYNKLTTGVFTEFPVRYFTARGEGKVFPNLEIGKSYQQFSFNRIFDLKNINEMFIGSREGIFVYNFLLLLALIGFKQMKLEKIYLLLIPLSLITFFLGFIHWSKGADFGWRNGLPILPSLMILSIWGLNYVKSKVTRLSILILGLAIFFVRMPVYLMTAWMPPKFRGREYEFYLENLGTDDYNISSLLVMFQESNLERFVLLVFIVIALLYLFVSNARKLMFDNNIHT